MLDEERVVPGQEAAREYNEASLSHEMTEWTDRNPTAQAKFFDNFAASLDRDFTWLPEDMRNQMITNSVTSQFKDKPKSGPEEIEREVETRKRYYTDIHTSIQKLGYSEEQIRSIYPNAIRNDGYVGEDLGRIKNMYIEMRKLGYERRTGLA